MAYVTYVTLCDLCVIYVLADLMWWPMSYAGFLPETFLVWGAARLRCSGSCGPDVGIGAQNTESESSHDSNETGSQGMEEWQAQHGTLKLVAWCCMNLLCNYNILQRLLVIGCYAFKTWVSRLAQTQETRRHGITSHSGGPELTTLEHNSRPHPSRKRERFISIHYPLDKMQGEWRETSWNILKPFFSICGDVPHSWLAWPVSWQRWELSQKVMLQGSFKIASLKTWKEGLQVASEILMLTLKARKPRLGLQQL